MAQHCLLVGLLADSSSVGGSVPVPYFFSFSFVAPSTPPLPLQSCRALASVAGIRSMPLRVSYGNPRSLLVGLGLETFAIPNRRPLFKAVAVNKRGYGRKCR